MKKFVFLCLTMVFFVSCSLKTDDTPRISYVFLPIEDVTLPDSFMLNETYQIGVTYYRPSTCHAFNDFYFNKSGNEYVVAVTNSVAESSYCEDLENDLVEVSFNFVCTYSGTYVFKFWQGLDANDNDLYYVVEVPVVE